MPEVKDVKPAVTKDEEDEEKERKEEKRLQELSEEEKQVFTDPWAIIIVPSGLHYNSIVSVGWRGYR